MNRVRTFFASVVLVAIVTSCASPAKVSDERDASGDKIEYINYTPSGSNIPIKVRKDSMKSSDSTAAARDKAFTDLQRDAIVRPPPTPGGK
jgi:hypothetical protein